MYQPAGKRDSIFLPFIDRKCDVVDDDNNNPCGKVAAYIVYNGSLYIEAYCPHHDQQRFY